jgi:SAM-dependent methyltransferase
MATSNSGNDRFNAEAAAWDSNPDVHRASSMALEAILRHFPDLKSHSPGSTSGLDVLEIGCGTGLLSFMVAPYVRSLTAVDVAEGMIEAFKIKLSKQDKVQNLLPVHAMLIDPDDARIRPDPLSKDHRHANDEGLPPRRFDLILSHLVMHHIPDLPEVFSTMHGCLKSGGSIALTDFEDFGPEARKFHPESKMDGVERHGIRRDLVKSQLKEAGFVDIRVETAFEMEKAIETEKGPKTGKMIFPFLICMAKKS